MKPLPEYKTAAAKKPRFVFSHYGYFKNLWDVLLILGMVHLYQNNIFSELTTATAKAPLFYNFYDET